MAANKANLWKFVFFLSGLMTFPRTLRKVLRGGSKGSFAQRAFGFLSSRAPAIVAQLVLIAAIASVFPWWYYLTFWILPIYVHVFLADEVRAFCEHSQPVIPDSMADPFRLITYVPNPIERMLFSPMNMNFHAEHHLWSYIPYYNTPLLHAYLKDRGDIEVRTSYVGYLWRYFRKLPLTPVATFVPGAA